MRDIKFMKKTLYVILLSLVFQVCYLSIGFPVTNSNYTGAIQFNNNYYRIFNSGMTWENAKRFCEDIKGHLVTIESENEQKFIEQLLRNKGNKNCYWVGGYKNASEEWKWVTNAN